MSLKPGCVAQRWKSPFSSKTTVFKHNRLPAVFFRLEKI